MNSVLHHFHKRKRVYSNLEPYPHPNKMKRIIDNCVYLVTVFWLVMTIPQITSIWIEKNAAGVSAVSWIGYLLSAGFWLAYGFVHKERPIILSSIAWIILEFFVVIGAFIYG